MHPLFIEKAHGLVAQTRGQGGDFQRLVPGGLGLRKQGALFRHKAVEIIQNAVAFDQRLARVQHQRRHPGERIIGPELVRIAERRPGPVAERQAIKRQRNADTANKGRVILANQDHGWTLPWCGPRQQVLFHY